MMSMLVCGCVCCLSSRSAGVDGVNRKGGKRSADGDLKYCGNFSSKDTHDTDN